MSKLASVALLSSASGLVLLVSSDASACWNGVVGSAEGVAITEFEDEPVWSAARVRDHAGGLKRIEALVPPGHTVSTPDPVTIHLDGPDEDSPEDDTFESVDFVSPQRVFEAVVKLTRTKKKARRRALAIKTDVFTVQVGALADEAGAKQLAWRASHSEAAEWGFFRVEWDATSGRANVVRERDAKGRVLHKVVSGAFFEEKQARIVAAKLGRELGVTAFVRKL